MNYQKQKCTKQPVGVNKFGNIPKEIATYLHLENPKLYTGHCFRRSSATILVDAGGDITTLKRHGGWKSTTVAESYIDESLTNKMEVANTILQSVVPAAVPSSSKCTTSNPQDPPAQLVKESESSNETNVQINHTLSNLMSDKGVTHPIIFNNCQNNTINITIVTDKKIN